MNTTAKTFEQSLAELESIVDQLESNEFDLEEGLKLFEKGVSLYKICRKQLNKVEKKIAKLSDDLKEEALED